MEAAAAVGTAKRSLFGPVDHDASIQFVRRELELLQKEAQEKWNFDFKSETPLPGPYVWTSVRVPPLNDPDAATSSGGPGKSASNATSPRQARITEYLRLAKPTAICK